MKFFYNLWRENGYFRQYEHVHVDVYSGDANDWSKPIISFKWQGDVESDHWYAFRATTEVERHSGAVQQFRQAANIMAKLEQTNTEDPKAVIQALGFTRMVRDDRCSEWMEPDKVKPATWNRYMAWLDGSCVCSAMAPDEETAGKYLVKRFAEQADSGWGNYVDKLERWIKDGKTVKVDDYRHAPDVRSIDDILKPMKDPTPKTEPELVAA